MASFHQISPWPTPYLNMQARFTMIDITSSDGHSFSAYRADPGDAAKGAVIVLQEFFGLNSYIQKEADRFAAKGYVAIAPSLFDREKKGVSLAYDQTGLSEGIELTKSIGIAHALDDIQATIDSVANVGKVAIVGYSWGGYLAYLSANRVRGLSCAVGYYGPGIPQDSSEKRKVPTLLHFGEADFYIPFEDVVQFRANRPEVSAFSYPNAGHGFHCDEREAYNAQAAEVSLERTLFWISQFVEGQPPIALKNSGSYAQQKTDKKKKKSDGDDMGPPME
jgi:carboxymethylenebutenolidase